MHIEDTGWRDESGYHNDTTYTYASDSLIVKTDRLGQITYVEFETHKLTTARGIKIGDLVSKVWLAYALTGTMHCVHGDPDATRNEDDAVGVMSGGDSLLG